MDCSGETVLSCQYFVMGNDFKRNSSQLRKKYLQKQPVNLFGDVEDPNRQI